MFPSITRQTRANLQRGLLQKSGPTRRQNYSTVYFPIVIGNYQNITSFFIQEQKVLAKSIGLCWDHFFGRGGARDVFAFHEFSFFFDLVFCKMPEIVSRKHISTRMALVLIYASSAGGSQYVCCNKELYSAGSSYIRGILTDTLEKYPRISKKSQWAWC